MFTHCEERCMSQYICVESKANLDDGSLLPSCGAQGWSSSCQAWQWVLTY